VDGLTAGWNAAAEAESELCWDVANLANGNSCAIALDSFCSCWLVAVVKRSMASDTWRCKDVVSTAVGAWSARVSLLTPRMPERRLELSLCMVSAT